MAPHLVRARSAYKDIRIYAHFIPHPPTQYTHTHYKYKHYW